MFAPALAFGDMIPHFIPDNPIAAAVFGIIMFAAVLGLSSRPAAFLSAFAALLVLELFFNIVYPSYYRHQALYLVYLIVMYWLTATGRGGAWSQNAGTKRARIDARMVGSLAFSLLLIMQVIGSYRLARYEVGAYPLSRSRDLAGLLVREKLGNAIILSDPDYMLEPLHYYLPVSTYLMRAQRFDNIVPFRKDVRLELDLDDFLRDGRRLQARTGRPVVILLEKRLDPGEPEFRIRKLHFWYFNGSPEQIARFLASTRRLARFGPAITEETYDVYLLDPPTAPRPELPPRS
jgi:hypothetical protein